MIYGTIYGDIAGSLYESIYVKDIDSIYIRNESTFTDDTVLTLAVASWLLKNKYDTNVLIHELKSFANMYPYAGYGGSFIDWCKSADSTPYGSWGNGSAMRVSPCAWVAKSLHESEELAKQSAIVTHNHREGVIGAQAVCAAIYMARNGASKEHIKDYISDKYCYNLDRSITEIKQSGYEFDVSCQGSVPEAIIAFLESSNYKNAIELAISLNGDTDTQAAIAGSIAEAFYGFPKELECVVEEKLDNFLLFHLKQFNNHVKELELHN